MPMTMDVERPRGRRWLSWMGAVVAVGLVAIATWLGVRVVGLERHELDYSSSRVRLDSVPEAAKTARLGMVTLEEGDNVRFDVCTEHGFDRALFLNAIDIAVWQPEAREVLVRTPFDDARLAEARNTVDGTCIEVAQGTARVAGPYAVEALWDNRTRSEALGAVEMIVRVQALRPLIVSDKLPIWIGFGWALLSLIIVLTHREQTRYEGAARHAVPRILAALFFFALAFFGTELVPFSGATGALIRGVFLAIAQIVIAFALIPHADGEPRTIALAWRGVRHNHWLIAPACILLGGALAVLNGVVTSRIVPSTSEAPIEALVTFPSAGLAVALVALLAPLSEELFFRGFVFGSVDQRWGRTAAWISSVLLFAAAHIPQTWGAWGATLSVFITGILLTAVRARTESSAASMLTHLSHNALITVLSL